MAYFRKFVNWQYTRLTNFILFPQYIGYQVEKGTVIFINNHELSMSDNLWTNPSAYNPSRFLEDNNTQDKELRSSSTNNSDHNNTNGTIKYVPIKTFKKPKHFQPFSMGRRMCMGYKIVQNVSYSIVASLLQHFIEEKIGQQ